MLLYKHIVLYLGCWGVLIDHTVCAFFVLLYETIVDKKSLNLSWGIAKKTCLFYGFWTFWKMLANIYSFIVVQWFVEIGVDGVVQW